MSRIVRCSLIQATNAAPPDASLSATKQAMMDKHVAYIEQAAKAGAQIVCLQEIFYGPYFCAEQTTKWYDFTEPIPDGPTIRLMSDLAKRLGVIMIVPIYEKAMTGVFYNTAAVIDDGNPCTRDLCSQGTPSNPFSDAETTCPSGVCDGQGHCVACVSNADCGTNGPCATFTCSAGHTCSHVFGAAGTAITAQTGGDCKVVQCDGNGGQTTVTDGNDVAEVTLTARGIVADMKAGSGPHLLDCHTTRVRGHFEGDVSGTAFAEAISIAPESAFGAAFGISGS